MRAGLLIALVVTLTACGSIAENVAEQATEEAIEQAAESEGGGDVDIDVQDDGVSFSQSGEDGESEMQIGGDVEIPEGLEVPIPDGGTLTSSFTQSSGDETTHNVSAEFPGDAYEEVVAFYEDHFGEDVDRTSVQQEGLQSETFIADDGATRVIVNLLDDTTVLTISATVTG